VYACVCSGECAHPHDWCWRGIIDKLGGGGGFRVFGRKKRRCPETRVLGENSPTGTAGCGSPGARRSATPRCTWTSRAEHERVKAPALVVSGLRPSCGPRQKCATKARRSGDRSNRRHAVWTARGLRLHDTADCQTHSFREA